MSGIYIINILLKSGGRITTAVTGLRTKQKPDGTGYSEIDWKPCDKHNLKVLKQEWKDLCVVDSINVGQVEAIAIVHET